ncbi:hypothetical protein AAFF_G00001460 [Aldrovandia affinis]|uniref:Uncharacterized protein n=1 Tax=Aldrovandia affinis TaxID=143900 RepID=A0AAD7X315_9TELE|nr:hypothetical protein AAFF_G00001460 [Aldrovandia affinis]
MKGPEKTLEERRSSLDAEIDSLTSILADLENSSPYKPRDQQNYGGSSATSSSSSSSAPVSVHKRMVIPTQPPLTATKKANAKPQMLETSTPPMAPSPVPVPLFQSAPVPASYATASTPSQPTYNVNAKEAQSVPQHMLAGPQPDTQHAALSPAPLQPMATMPQGPAFAHGSPQPGQGSQPPDPRKTYVTDPSAPGAPQKGPAFSSTAGRPEDELDRLTKKMIFDMDNPPAEEFFGESPPTHSNSKWSSMLYPTNTGASPTESM